MALRFPANHCISNTIIEPLWDANYEVVRGSKLYTKR
jgi:hypothetical protein